MKKQLIFLFLLTCTNIVAQASENYNFSAALVKRLTVKSADDGNLIQLFSDDQVELADYIKNDTSEIVEFYFNGKKYFTDKTNLFIPDSTLNNVKNVTEANRDLVRNEAKKYSKYCYDIEVRKAQKYYKEAKEKGIILINSLDQNSFDNSNNDYEFEFINTSPKTIHKIWITLVGYGNENISSIVEAKTVLFNEFVKEEEFGYKRYKNVWKNKRLTFRTISTIKIEYVDGSQSVFNEAEHFPQSYLFYVLGKTFQIDNLKKY